MGTTNLLLAVDQGQTFVDGLLTVIGMIMLALSILLIVYGVYLFFLMATATDEGKRRSAKNRVIKTFSSILIVVALVSILQVVKVKINTNIDSSKNGGGNNLNIEDSNPWRTDTIRNLPDFNITVTKSKQPAVNAAGGGHSVTLYNYTYTGNYKIDASRIPTKSGYTISHITDFAIVDPQESKFFDTKWEVEKKIASGSYEIKYDYSSTVSVATGNTSYAKINVRKGTTTSGTVKVEVAFAYYKNGTDGIGDNLKFGSIQGDMKIVANLGQDMEPLLVSVD